VWRVRKLLPPSGYTRGGGGGCGGAVAAKAGTTKADSAVTWGQGRDQGGQRSDVGTEQLPASTLVSYRRRPA
jgi:hypothetical protein